MNNKRQRLVITFLILIILMGLNSFRIYDDLNNFNQFDYQSKKNSIEIIKRDIEKISNSLFVNIINTSEVISLFKDAHTANKEQKAIIRKKLYDLLIDKYNNFTKYDIQQLHFHLPNNDSFLRFHKPNKFGDNLTKIRASVKYVNETKKPIVGFEEGKIFNGFRFVYPLFDTQNKHIGSVEISSSLLSFKSIFELNNNEHMDFILTKKTVEDKVFKSQLSNYTSYHNLDNFYIQSTLNDFNQNRCQHKHNIKIFFKKLQEDYNFKRDINKLKKMIYSKFINNQLFTIHFIPFKNDFTKEPVGYTIIFAKSKYLDFFTPSIILSYILLIFFAIFIGFMLSLSKNLKEKKENLKLLLNHANDGFISFNMDYKILEGSSSKSKNILNQNNLNGKNIVDILFQNNIKEKELFIAGIKAIKKSNDEESQNLILSILPSKTFIENKIIEIDYKIIDEDRIMIILKDISLEEKLQSKIKIESSKHKMIIASAKNKEFFKETVDQYGAFLNTPLVDKTISYEENVLKLSQELHTYKGIFAQQFFAKTPTSIHKFEDEIFKLNQQNEHSIEELMELIKNSSLKDDFEDDISYIYSILGENFFKQDNLVCFSSDIFEKIEIKIDKILNSQKPSQEDVEFLRNKILHHHEKNLYLAIVQFNEIIQSTAQELHKEVKHLLVYGDKSLSIPAKYNNFIKSLIHIFKNMVDHGIEIQTNRIKKHKNPKGIISVHFKIHHDKLYLSIEDDGAGIDLEKLKLVAKEKGLYTSNQLNEMSNSELFHIILESNFSTKYDINTISGRGVGLSAVKEELEKIKGTLSVESQKDHFTRFNFIIPF